MSFIKRCGVMVLCFSIMLLAACGLDQASSDKVKDIEFTVVNEEDIPEILKNAIEEKKAGPFKLSYSDNEMKYLVVGYGEQTTGGFSIVIDELYTTENTIVFGTTLKGPEEGDTVQDAVSYPYIVVKMENLDYEVIYK